MIKPQSMTNKEAIRRLIEHNDIHQNKEPRAIYITEALNMAIAALEAKIPDPETGLVPCGCGGKLKLHKIRSFMVYCQKCPWCIGDFDTKEEAVKTANTAMGYREEKENE